MRHPRASAGKRIIPEPERAARAAWRSRPAAEGAKLLASAAPAEVLRKEFGAGPNRALAPVAQLDRALPSEGRGREFESRRVRHIARPTSFACWALPVHLIAEWVRRCAAPKPPGSRARTVDHLSVDSILPGFAAALNEADAGAGTSTGSCGSDLAGFSGSGATLVAGWSGCPWSAVGPTPCSFRRSCHRAWGIPLRRLSEARAAALVDSRRDRGSADREPSAARLHRWNETRCQRVDRAVAEHVRHLSTARWVRAWLSQSEGGRLRPSMIMSERASASAELCWG